jgi:hypothetical protein
MKSNTLKYRTSPPEEYKYRYLVFQVRGFVADDLVLKKNTVVNSKYIKTSCSRKQPAMEKFGRIF